MVVFTYNDRELLPPSKCFSELDLYTTFFGPFISDIIERRMFGEIDDKGARAVRAFIEDDLLERHKRFKEFFYYIDAQKARTPKGLTWLKARYGSLGQTQLMNELQVVQRMHCTMWFDGVREIVSAKKANAKSLRKTKKVALIPVTTNIGNGAHTPTSFTIIAIATNLMQFLRQALITPIISSSPLNVKTNNTFNNNYTHLNASNINSVITSNDNSPLSPSPNLADFLTNILVNGDNLKAATNNQFNGIFKIFLFAELGGFIDTNWLFIQLNGLTVTLNGTTQDKGLTIFSSATATTVPHEFLHAVNLPHSFAAVEASQYAKFSYAPLVTDNLMDYSATRLSLWNWQTYIANSFSDPEP
jgi:hypothetical protein